MRNRNGIPLVCQVIIRRSNPRSRCCFPNESFEYQMYSIHIQFSFQCKNNYHKLLLFIRSYLPTSYIHILAWQAVVLPAVNSTLGVNKLIQESKWSLDILQRLRGRSSKDVTKFLVGYNSLFASPIVHRWQGLHLAARFDSPW